MARARCQVFLLLLSPLESTRAKVFHICSLNEHLIQKFIFYIKTRLFKSCVLEVLLTGRLFYLLGIRLFFNYVKVPYYRHPLALPEMGPIKEAAWGVLVGICDKNCRWFSDSVQPTGTREHLQTFTLEDTQPWYYWTGDII